MPVIACDCPREMLLQKTETMEVMRSHLSLERSAERSVHLYYTSIQGQRAFMIDLVLEAPSSAMLSFREQKWFSFLKTLRNPEVLAAHP